MKERKLTPFERVKAEFSAMSTHRWHWDQIDYCATGKDADLEPWGDQGLHLVSVGICRAHAVAHLCKTFAGSDVALNTPPHVDNNRLLYEQCVAAYLEAARDVVAGCGVMCEWDGDSWIASFSQEFDIAPVVSWYPATVDSLATARALARRMNDVLADTQKALVETDAILDQLAGWKDARGRRMRAGWVPACAAYKRLIPRRKP